MRANGMRIFQELMLSMCAAAIGNLIWSALAAVW
jgi:hypothetical protein